MLIVDILPIVVLSIVMTTTSLEQPTYSDYRHALAYVSVALLVTGIDPRALAYGGLMDTVTDTTLHPLCDLWQHEHLVPAIGDALDVPRDTRDYSAAVIDRKSVV